MLNPRTREQLQNARENPIAAAAAAAAASGGPPPTQNNAENLLDIDFDGAAPASAQKDPALGSSALESLTHTPERVGTPGVQTVKPAGAASHGNNLDDLLGVFGDSQAPQGNSTNTSDLLNGFASLDMGAGNQPPPPGSQLAAQGGGAKRNNEDILSLF